MVKIILLVLLAESIIAIGQILFKKSTNNIGIYNLKVGGDRIRFLSEIFKKPSLWFGLMAMVIGLVVWLLAIAQGNLSLVFPIGSLQYILILFLAHKFLNEKIDIMKLAGTLLVVAGITLMALS